MTSEAQSKFLSGLPHEAEVRLPRKDGKYRWFLFRYNPLRDEQGRLTRWYVAATDIEDRKQAEQRLCAKKSIRHRCSRRSSELLPSCKRYFLVSPRSLLRTPPFWSPAKPGRARNWLPAPFTGV